MAALALAAASLAWNQYGSIYARDWLPYAVATALVAAGLAWNAQAQRPTRAAAVGIVGLLGLAAWDAISVAWSPVPDLARDEALLVLFYTLVLLVPVLVLREDSDRRLATAVVVALIGALSLAAFVKLILAAHPTDLYEHGRLTFPISYVNAQAALFLVAFWPCVGLASERASRPIVRAGAVGGTCAMLAGWLLTQSKGGLVALVAGGILFFTVCSSRLRAVVPVLIPAALVGSSYLLLTRPFRERNSTEFADAIQFAASTALVLTAVGAAAGLTYALIDRRVRISKRTERVAGVLLLAGLAAALVTGVATFLVAVDRPGHYLSAKWDSFKTLPAQEHGSSHLTSLGSNRYDFWRVSLHEFERHPLAGLGARGFSTDYLREGHSNETPQRAHSLGADALGETGIIGFLLLAAAMGAPLVSLVRRARVSLLGAGLLGATTYWLVHASGDWIWTLPAVMVPAFLFVGIGLSNSQRGKVLSHPNVTAAVLVAIAILVFGPPWVSARLTDDALQSGNSDSAALRWAGRLDPLSPAPLLARADLAGPQDRTRYLRAALEKAPRRPDLHYRLGLAYLATGQRAAARAELEEARRLAPRDRLISRALRRTG